MRAIDADKLIDIFSNLAEYDKYTAVFIDQIIKIINEQPTVKSEKCVAEVSISKEQLETVMKPQIDELKQFLSGWIPVDERLPKDHEDVLCWYEYYRYGDYDCMFQTYGIGYCCDGHWGGDVNGHKSRVIAWKPLPEPYKGASENDD